MGSAISGISPTPKSSQFVLDPSISKVTPDWKEGKLSHDPHYGFDGKKRKERVMVATEEEMISAKVPLKWRDFCAHKYIQMEKCRKDMFPFPIRCQREKHELEECQFEDQIIRMKEYERERRLLYRKARKEEKARKAAEAAAAAAAAE